MECRWTRAKNQKEKTAPRKLPVNVAESLFIIPRLKSIGVLFLKRFKKNEIPLPLLALLATLVFLGGGVFWWLWAVRPASSDPKAPVQIFVITKGESLEGVLG